MKLLLPVGVILVIVITRHILVWMFPERRALVNIVFLSVLGVLLLIAWLVVRRLDQLVRKRGYVWDEKAGEYRKVQK